MNAQNDDEKSGKGDDINAPDPFAFRSAGPSVDTVFSVAAARADCSADDGRISWLIVEVCSSFQGGI